MMRTRIFSRCLIVGLVFLSLTIAACEYPADPVRVFNDSSQTVELVQGSGDTRISLTKLRPGMGYTTRQECVADFVVLSLEGEELARRPGPFCQGEPEWVITGEMLAGLRTGPSA